MIGHANSHSALVLLSFAKLILLESILRLHIFDCQHVWQPVDSLTVRLSDRTEEAFTSIRA